jgi:hypothetical protein
MHDRRGKRDVEDSAARTRRTDHVHTPHVVSDWMTTFNLRWVEHLKQHRPNGDEHKGGLAGA